MVPEQVHAYEFMRRNKVLRFERDSKENENRKERRRTAHVVKGARYGKANECDLQEKRLSHVAAQDGTPRQSLRIACMENNIDKRTVETAKNYLKGKRPHVDGVVESEDAEFVLADFVRNVQSPAIRKDYDDDLPVLPLSSIDPSLLRRYNDLNDTITSARRDSKKDMIAFGTGLGDIPIGKVGQSFWEKGMLMTRLVNFGVSLLIDNFKGSLAIVVPFHICTNIWNGGSISKPVKLMFSSRSEEHDDEKDMVLFATFDPPNTKEGEIIGHYWVVALNLKENRFEFLDSLNKPGSDEANKMTGMTLLLKRVYGEKAYNSKNLPDWFKLIEKPSFPPAPE
ncbi:hypothetical protein ZWY2020_052136 [Hordeum vulgare]|nr:hypothetical protein ZWY2020_052136 [Hordeum vulgare]